MIFYFTGTGNSRYVATKIGRITGEEPVDLFSYFRDGIASSFSSETPYIFCTPTYAWQIPHIVRDWILKCTFSGNMNAYFIMTCGDGIGNASEYAEALCKQKGLIFKGLSKVVMPENYIAMFNAPDKNEAIEIIHKADSEIEKIAAEIKHRNTISSEHQFGGAILSSIVNKCFYKFSISDKPFTVNDDCSSCGLCSKNCPVDNIQIISGKPVWNGKCIHCMACICHCPKEAIEYGKKSLGKPRYTCPF